MKWPRNGIFSIHSATQFGNFKVKNAILMVHFVIYIYNIINNMLFMQIIGGGNNPSSFHH